MALVLLSILFNYLFGLAIGKAGGRKGLRRAALAVCVGANLCLLGYFKYFNFFLELAYTVLGKEGFTPRNIALPIGISFYTFQAVSYIADIYRGCLLYTSRPG